MSVVRQRSLTRHTLVLVAVSVAGIVLAATGIAYYAVFRAMEAMGQQLLEQYASERARRQEANIRQAEANHRVLKAAFLERWRQPADPDFQARFEAHFARDADGAMRSRRELVDPMREANTWIRAGAPITPELQRLVMLCHDLCEQFFPAWYPQFSSLYISSPLQFNTGIAPLLPEWVWELDAHFDQDNFEWSVISSQANNPERRSVWTGILTDESNPDKKAALKFATLCTPVDVNGRHLVTLHHDIFLEDLMSNELRSERAGITHVIFREDGRLIANTEDPDELYQSAGRLMVQDSRDHNLRSIFAAVTTRSGSGSSLSGYDPVSGRYFAATRLEGPEWIFVTQMPRAQLRREAFRSAQWVLWAGGASLVFVLGTLALILRRQVQQPIQELLAATRRVATGQPVDVLPVGRADEIGELASAFNQMARRVAERDADLERRIADRTLELRDSEARLRTLLDHSPIAIVTVDADTGRFVDGNEHALLLLGVDRDTLLARGPAEVSPPTQPDGRTSAEAARAWMEAALAGGARVFEWVHRDSAGREIQCEVYLARLPASGRRLLVGALLDITTRKQTEAELLRTLARERELGQLKSEFVSMVSHEFRTPLEVIQSSSDLLDGYFDRLEPAERRSQVHAIHRSVRRMAGMMESVLLLSRVEAGTVSYHPAPLDVQQWCRRLVDEIHSATSCACPIALEFRGEAEATTADAMLLRHIFGNLLTNAVKYSEPGTAVHFVVERDGDRAVFRVIDRGRGIPETDRARLFRAFQRGRNVGQVPGTGLGLVIVKRCVDLHGGEIRCESREGAGTTFVVTLPLFKGAGVRTGGNAMEEIISNGQEADAGRV